MQILPGVPAHQLDPSHPILTTFIVLGPGHADARGGYHAGRIKAVRFGPNIDSPLLLIEPIKRGGRMSGVKGLHISASEQAKGTRFLRDLYAEEGRLADYDRYVAREQAIKNGMRVAPMEPTDPRLPAKVVAWVRERGERGTFSWDGDAEPEAQPEPETQPAPSAAPVRRRAATSDGA